MKFNFFKNSNLPFVIKVETEHDRTDVALQQWISDNHSFLFEKLYQYGGVLFRGFLLENPNIFLDIVKTIKPELMNYKGGDSPREKILDKVYTSTSHPKEFPIALHNEMSYSKSYPAILFFFSEIVASFGGETPLLDGRILHAKLRKNVLEKFQSKKLKYVMNLHDGFGFGKSWQSCFETGERALVDHHLKSINACYRWKKDGGLRIETIVDPVIRHSITNEEVFFSQADQWHPSFLDPEQLKDLKSLMSEEDFHHHCFYGDGSPIEEEFLDYIRTIVVQNSIKFSWELNDFLVLDNVLSLHGRSPYQGERKVLVAMA